MRLDDVPQPVIRRVAYEASLERLPDEMTLTGFLMALHGWRFRGLFRGATCIGAVMDRDGVVHISILPDYRKRWAGAGIIKEIISSARSNGRLRTFVAQGDTFRAEFARRLGFVFAGNQGNLEIFDHA
jgi:GNAT superfamily N-acetyltransferase